MPETPENEVIELLRNSLSAGKLPKSLKVTFRLAGGAPSKRIMEEVQMSGSGKHQVSRSDEIRGVPLEKATLELSPADTRELWQRIVQDIDKMVPRSEAAFLPDTVLGSITVEMGDRKADFFYAIEEDEVLAERTRASPGVMRLTEELRALVSQKLDGSRRLKSDKRR